MKNLIALVEPAAADALIYGMAIASPPHRTLRILIIDDDPDHTELARLALDRLDPGYRLDVQSCDNFDDGLARLQMDPPFDLAFIDYRLGTETGDQLIGQAREAGVRTVIIAMTSQGDQYAAADVTRAGAQHFVLKSDFATPRFAEIFETAIDEHEQLRHQIDLQRDAQRRLENLTPREKEVLELVIAGRLSKQIAMQLGCAEGTVKLHRSRMLAKTRSQTSSELVRLALTARGVGDPMAG